MDHIAYQQQRHKQCAFNLYTAAMLEHALAPLARARGDRRRAEEFARRGRDILAAAVRRFWSPERGLFVNNLPWLAEDKGLRLCDRSLATAVAVRPVPRTATRPRRCGRWSNVRRRWAFPIRATPAGATGPWPGSGRADVVVRDFRQRWAKMKSVVWNNTLQEDWD